MSKITCNFKTIAFREFFINILFSYFWVSYNIVKLQTSSSLHSWVIATSRLSLLSKSVITWKLLHLEYFVWICFPPTFYTLIVNLVLYFRIPFAGHHFLVLFFIHFYFETQNTQSADTEPIQGHGLLLLVVLRLMCPVVGVKCEILKFFSTTMDLLTFLLRFS